MQNEKKWKKKNTEKQTHTHILNIYIISKTYSILYIATRINYIKSRKRKRWKRKEIPIHIENNNEIKWD